MNQTHQKNQTKLRNKCHKPNNKKTDQKIQARLKQQHLYEPNPVFAQRMRHLAEGLINQSAQIQNKKTSNSRCKNRRRLAVVTAALTVLLPSAILLASAAHSVYTAHLTAQQQYPSAILKNQKPDAHDVSNTQADTKKTVETNYLSDVQAISAAADYVHIMYGVSKKQLRQMQSSLSLEHSPLSEPSTYRVRFVSDSNSDQICYQAVIDANNGSFLNICLEKEGFSYYQDNFAVDKAKLRKKGLKAKRIAARLIKDASVITDSYIQYKLDENGRVPHGTAVCLFDLANGDRIRISYSMAEHTLWGAVREKGGAGQRDANVRENETRMFLELDESYH